MIKHIATHGLHKTNKVLEKMNNDSRIDKEYVIYTESVKSDMEHILDYYK